MHCAGKVPILSGVKVKVEGCPGMALRMNRKAGMKNPCMTSREMSVMWTGSPDQRARIGLSMSRSPMRTQRSSYAAYSIGCAGVWGVILLLARRRVDAQTWNTLRLVCSGWWMGWS